MKIVQKQALINNRSTCFDQDALCTFTGTLTIAISKPLEQPDLRLIPKKLPETSSTQETLV